MDDSFRLGNFGGMENSDGLDDLDDLAGAPTKAQSAGQPIMKRPNVASDPQPKFHTSAGQPFLEIELEQIVPNEFQPRRIFNEEKLHELAESIRAHGIIQPLVVVKRTDGRYEIVVGERRFRAARLAGLSRVPVFVNASLSDEAKLEVALIENIQRADLNPVEEARAYQRLQQEFGLSLQQIAQRVGKHDSTISNLIRLLNLPVEIQRALIEEVISEGQARPLLSLRDNEEMLQMFQIVVRDQMKVRDIESKVREIRKRKIKVQEMFTPDPFLESLENLLRNKLGTRVAVNKGAKGGKITIEFYSDEELNDIVSKFT
jgi:ParB family chromosome partitioning protein